MWRQSRWSLVRFIRAVCSEHIKYSLHTQRNFTEGAVPAIHIHPLHTEAHNQTEGKHKHRAWSCKYHLWVTSAFWMTVKSAPFSLSFPCSLPLQIHFFLPNHAIPSSLPPFSETTFHTFLLLEHDLPPFFLSFGGAELIFPSSFLLFPPSCEIAVVSYGFLFLRDW